MSRDVYVCETVRTPIGRYSGALASVRPDDLAAIPIRALLRRHAVEDHLRQHIERIDRRGASRIGRHTG